NVVPSVHAAPPPLICIADFLVIVLLFSAQPPTSPLSASFLHQ
ncbi:hypothetical protein A2U01_0083314, partial [Trifolium medium]|nr:hypothetical protein [Trifolium medium]